MFTVAVIGPDGAGKTTVTRRLASSFPLPIKYLYMGYMSINSDPTNRMLPTTWLARRIRRALTVQSDPPGPLDPRVLDAPMPRNPLRRVARTIKSFLGLANKLAEEWYRQGLVWYYRSRGSVVIFDRHYFVDYYAYDIKPTNAERTLARRIHGYLLDRIYPKPDLVILLDAPAELLFNRKAEGTVELLELRRRDYLEIAEHVPHYVIVDASQPIDAVARDVQERILEFHRSKSSRL